MAPTPKTSPRRSPRGGKLHPAPAIRKSKRIANGSRGKSSTSARIASKAKKAAARSKVYKKKESASKAKNQSKYVGGGAASVPKARTDKAKRGNAIADKSKTASTPRRGKALVRGLRRSARIAAKAA